MTDLTPQFHYEHRQHGKVLMLYRIEPKVEQIQRNNQIETAIKNNLDYICNETLTNTLVFVEQINNFGIAVDVDETLSTFISVQKN